MKPIKATAHARQRMQQRGITEMQIRLIEAFGRYEYQKGGVHIAFVPEKIIAELRNAVDKLSDVALICGESDQIVTAMHKRQRLTTTQYSA